MATNLLAQKYELGNWEKVKIKVNIEEEILKLSVTHAILSFKLRVLESKYEDNLKQMQNETSQENLDILMDAQLKLRKKISMVSNELGGRIVLR